MFIKVLKKHDCILITLVESIEVWQSSPCISWERLLTTFPSTSTRDPKKKTHFQDAQSPHVENTNGSKFSNLELTAQFMNTAGFAWQQPKSTNWNYNQKIPLNHRIKGQHLLTNCPPELWDSWCSTGRVHCNRKHMSSIFKVDIWVLAAEAILKVTLIQLHKNQ